MLKPKKLELKLNKKKYLVLQKRTKTPSIKNKQRLKKITKLNLNKYR